MHDLKKANVLIEQFENRITHPVVVSSQQKLYTGVDLGTAYIVLAVVDQSGMPVAGAMQFAQVVKDGIVVDYIAALDIVKELKNKIEKSLGRELLQAAAAYPPGTEEATQKTISYIAEGAGFEITAMYDEPTAANNVFGISDGAVVDIGGGTTGTAILKNGEVVHVADDPTGGTHLSLVIAGANQLTFEEAEELKKDKEKQRELLPIVKPVIEKMGSIVKKHLAGYCVNAVYLAGGTCCFKGIDKLLEKEIGIPVYLPKNPFLVTPLGIALGGMICK